MRCWLTAALAASLIGCGGAGGGSVSADGGGTPGSDAMDGGQSPDSASDGTGSDLGDDAGGEVTSEDGGSDAGPEPTVVYGVPCESAERIGLFQVAHEEFYAQVSGEVAAGVIPLTVLQEVESEGDCRLMQKKNPFCDPGCGASQLCDHDGTCVPYPENQSVGVVTVSGLNDGDVVMEPKNDSYFDTNVSMPLFDPGDGIELVASGDELPGFELKAFGVPDLELPEGVITMKEGQPLDIAWTAAPGAWRLYFSLNIDQHGSSPATLFCDVEDTGSFQVPAHFVDSILSMGVSGFATAHFYRRTVDSTQLDAGCVQLTVSSYVYGKLDVEGHTACNVDPDCPEGEICEKAINTCVEGG